MRACVASGCGTPSNLGTGDLEFYPLALKPVFCPDVERFKTDDNSTCPGVPTVTKPGADYALRYQFDANMVGLGK